MSDNNDHPHPDHQHPHPQGPQASIAPSTNAAPGATAAALTAGGNALNERTYQEVEYLKRNLGPILVAALAEICIRRPADPIEYLGHWLLRWRYNEELKRRDVQNALEVVRRKTWNDPGAAKDDSPIMPVATDASNPEAFADGFVPTHPYGAPGFGGPLSKEQIHSISQPGADPAAVEEGEAGATSEARKSLIEQQEHAQEQQEHTHDPEHVHDGEHAHEHVHDGEHTHEHTHDGTEHHDGEHHHTEHHDGEHHDPEHSQDHDKRASTDGKRASLTQDNPRHNSRLDEPKKASIPQEKRPSLGDPTAGDAP